jgi:hypothetical protein
MSVPLNSPQPAGSPDVLHARFLIIMPRIEIHATIYFRHVKCPDRRADKVAETLALAWKWFVRLSQRGKDPLMFPSALASYAAKHVRSGRKVCGQDKAKDAMSEIAQQRHGFTVSSLPDGSSLHGNVFDEALQDNTRSEVPEQVAFRIDFPAWRLTRTDRDRRIVDDLMVGERTMDVSKKFGVSPGRISQLRTDFHQDWSRFTADPGDADTSIQV